MFYFSDGDDVTALTELGYIPAIWIQLFFPHCKKGVRASPRPAPCYHARGQLEWWRGSEDGTDARDTASVMVMTPPDIFIGDIVTAPLADHTHAVEVWTPPPSQIINRPSVQLDCNYLFVVGQLIRTRHFQPMNIFRGYPHPYCCTEKWQCNVLECWARQFAL